MKPPKSEVGYVIFSMAAGKPYFFSGFGWRDSKERAIHDFRELHFIDDRGWRENYGIAKVKILVQKDGSHV